MKRRHVDCTICSFDKSSLMLLFLKQKCISWRPVSIIWESNLFVRSWLFTKGYRINIVNHSHMTYLEIQDVTIPWCQLKSTFSPFTPQRDKTWKRRNLFLLSLFRWSHSAAAGLAYPKWYTRSDYTVWFCKNLW